MNIIELLCQTFSESQPAHAGNKSWLDWIIAGPDGTILVAEESDAKIIGLFVSRFEIGAGQRRS